MNNPKPPANVNYDPVRSAAESPGFKAHGVPLRLPHRCLLCRADSVYYSEQAGNRCLPHWLEFHGQPYHHHATAEGQNGVQLP